MWTDRRPTRPSWDPRLWRAGDVACGRHEGLLATATVPPVAVPDPVAGVLRLRHVSGSCSSPATSHDAFAALRHVPVDFEDRAPAEHHRA